MIWPSSGSVTQRLPSGPVVIAPGLMPPGTAEEADVAGRGDPADLLPVVVADGEVDVAVGPGRDPAHREDGEAERELGDLAGRRDPADLELRRTRRW